MQERLCRACRDLSLLSDLNNHFALDAFGRTLSHGACVNIFDRPNPRTKELSQFSLAFNHLSHLVFFNWTPKVVTVRRK